MGAPPDEHLPEVVPCSSPQAMTRQEAYQHQLAFDGYQKMAAESPDSPKYVDVPMGLESAYLHSPQQAHQPSPYSGVPWDPQSALDGLPAGTVTGTGTSTYVPESEKALPPVEEDRILGLRKRSFYWLLAIVLVFLAAAVGAGVGAGLAAANRNGGSSTAGQSSGDNPNAGSGDGSGGAEDSQPSNTIPRPTGNSTGNSTAPEQPNTTTKPKDKDLSKDIPTAPFRFQGWAGPNFTGERTQVYRTFGYVDMPFPIYSYVWNPDGYTCCMTFCNDTTTDPRYWRCTYNKQPNPTGPFSRVNMYCGGLDITGGPTTCS